MKKGNIKLKLKMDSEKAVHNIEKATLAAKKLKKALDELQNIEIGFKLTPIKKKWWQFWY